MEQKKKIVEKDQYKGHGVAVVTSGGDSQGMNPAVRAVVRVGLYAGCNVFYIREGYTGLITGGDNIIEATWSSVSSIIHKGGTIIGSARSKEFTTEEGRKKAVKNLVQRGIANLIIIGGDGSLTGANILRIEWKNHVEALKTAGEVTKEQADKCPNLRVVGIVGTIDNDFPGTDMTIGTDSALHRIQEAVFAIASTASSHKRTFIMEVMGRNCGFLALRTALTTEADYLFTPEFPAPDNWSEKCAMRINTSSELGKRLHLIILSEGATNSRNEPITAEMVKDVLTKDLHLDARITVLGHVQRGGSPSAYDRILGSRSGAEAVVALMELKPNDEPVVISTVLNSLTRVPLSECIQNIKAIREAIEMKDYECAIKLRGRGFSGSIDIYKMLNKLGPYENTTEKTCRNIAVIQIGTPAGGMNSCIYALVRSVLNVGGKVIGVFGSVEGLILGNFREIGWSDVYGLMFEGGSYLGTKRMVPPDELLPRIADNLKKYNINGFLIIGGFEAFATALKLYKYRETYSEFCIPIAVIPATTSNNVPGSDFSIGADTALNSIAKTCDLFRQSAMGTKSRVFIVETMGGRCGYLCTAGALATGADASYIFEEPFDIDDIVEDVRAVIRKMKHSNILRGLILRNECCNDNYTTDFLMRLYSEAGKHVFTTRKNILGHIQQGDIPSSFDRSLAVKMAVRCTTWFYEQFEKSNTLDSNLYLNSADSVVVAGLTDKGYGTVPIENLEKEADFHNRLSNKTWWMNLRPLCRILSVHLRDHPDVNVETHSNEC